MSTERRRACHTICGLLLSFGIACRPAANPDSQAVMTPSGDAGIYLECSSTQECYEKAERACPDGYSIVDRGAHDTVTTGAAFAHALGGVGRASSGNEEYCAESVENGDEASASVGPCGPKKTKVRELVISCRSGNASDGKAERRYASVEPPSGAVGFTFRMSVTEAQAECVRGKAKWLPVTGDFPGYYCTSTPAPIGAPASATLGFCDDKLCVLTVKARSEEGDLLGLFGKVRSRLEERYGMASTRDVQIPEECESSVLTCVDSGKAHVRYLWAWRDNHSLVVELQFDTVVVLYLDPAGTRAVRTRSL